MSNNFCFSFFFCVFFFRFFFFHLFSFSLHVIKTILSNYYSQMTSIDILVSAYYSFKYISFVFFLFIFVFVLLVFLFCFSVISLKSLFNICYYHNNWCVYVCVCGVCLPVCFTLCVHNVSSVDRVILNCQVTPKPSRPRLKRNVGNITKKNGFIWVTIHRLKYQLFFF